MPTRMETLTDIPYDLLDKIVASFASDRAKVVETKRQADGRWTVTAAFEADDAASRLKRAIKR